MQRRAFPRDGERRTRSISALSARVNLTVALAVTAASVSPTLAQDSAPPNAADYYEQAFRVLQDDAATTSPDNAFETADRLSRVITGGPITNEVRADLARLREAIELAHRAGSIREIDRGVDRADGVTMLLPHLAPMRQLTRVLLADAVVRLADGDASGAATSLGTSLAMVGHISQDRLVVSTLVAAAAGVLTAEQVQGAIDRGALEPEHAQAILETAGSRPGIDPFGLGAALDGEREMIRHTVLGVVDDDPRFEELVHFNSLLGLREGDLNPFADVPREQLLEELAACERIYDEAAAAVSDPDPESVRLRLADIEARVAAGEGGTLAKMTLPAFGRIFHVTHRCEEGLLAVMAQLDQLASGEATAQELTNAAPWLRDAARAAARLQPDEQRLIEAIRVAPNAFQGENGAEVRAEIERILDRHRDAIVEPILRAAAARQCRFGTHIVNPRQPEAIPSYAAGVRGALRFFLVDRLWTEHVDVPDPSDAADVADATTGDAPARIDDGTPPANETIARLAAVIHLTELISRDEGLHHALLATAILTDAAHALPTVLARSRPDRAELAPLATVVEAMDRADPLGHRRGLEATQRALIHIHHDQDPTRARRRELAARLDPNQTFAIALALQPLWADDADESCTLIEPGPLLLLSDLIDVEACAALIELQDTVAEAPVLFAGSNTPSNVRDPLGGVAVPTVADLSVLAQQAPTLLGTIDDLLRRATRRAGDVATE